MTKLSPQEATITDSNALLTTARLGAAEALRPQPPPKTNKNLRLFKV